MIIVRADSNEYIGTGHIMRCLSIAQCFKERGQEVLFVTADHKGDKLLRSIQTICLDSIWNDLEKEIQQFSTLITDLNPDLLLIDSYYVTDKYIDALSQIVTVAYIDDFNATHLNLDFIINYNIYADTLNYSACSERKTVFLLGPQYAPLREEFANLPGHSIKSVTDVMVSAGGSDPERITERIMEMICPRFPNIRFHFIVGALNPRLEAINKIAKENAIIHVNEQKMSALMQYCDIAISAAGTTLYELCAAGIPTVTYILADNQFKAAEAFDRKSMMINAGDCRGNIHFIDCLLKHLNELISDEQRRKGLSLEMKKIVDGNGAKRIANELIR